TCSVGGPTAVVSRTRVTTHEATRLASRLVAEEQRGRAEQSAVHRERDERIHFLLFEVAHQQHRAQVRQDAGHHAAEDRGPQRRARVWLQQLWYFERAG